MVIFVVIVLVGAAFIGWQLYQKKVASNATPVAPAPSVPNTSPPPPAPPAPVGTPPQFVQTPVGNLAPSTAAYYDPNRPAAPAGNGVDPIDRKRKLLTTGDWVYVTEKNDSFTLPNVSGSLQVQVGGGDGDITLKIYQGDSYVAGGVFTNIATVNVTGASGEYRATVDLSHPTGLETINRFGA